MNPNRFLYLALFFMPMCLACGKVSPNEDLYGVWYYDKDPDMYVKINERMYRDYLGGTHAYIDYRIRWKDKTHYELTVINAVGLGNMLKEERVVLKATIKEMTDDYCWIMLEHNGRSECMLLTRDRPFRGSTRSPC
ncbi:MAG TPA: hypothetical protein VD993_18580 [Chitinophagaceae bacterium]|nr:hypothetical protein [Chitinophagaceae bacterium]